MAHTTINVHTVVDIKMHDKLFDGFVVKHIVVTQADGSKSEIELFSAAPITVSQMADEIIQPQREAA